MNEIAQRHELSPDRLPWVKQPWETLPAFHGFALYRDLGMAPSLTEAARLLHEAVPHRNVEAIRRQFAGWSSQNRWVERSEAYVMHIDQRMREQREGAIGRMNRRYAAAAATASAAALRAMENPERLQALADELDLEALVRTLAAGQKVEMLATGQAVAQIGRSAFGITHADAERIFRDLVELALPFMAADRQPLYAQAVQAYIQTGERQAW